MSRIASSYFASLFLFLTTLLIFPNFSAELEAKSGEKEYLAFAEVMPEPKGGMKSIIKKIKYPSIAKKGGIQGRVYVLAYIDENGNCTDAKIVKGIGAGCDEEALKAVKSVKFNPGKNQGAAVKVKLSLPIEFKL